MYSDFAQFFSLKHYGGLVKNKHHHNFLKTILFFTWTDSEVYGRPTSADSPAVESVLMGSVRILKSGNGTGQKSLPSLFFFCFVFFSSQRTLSSLSWLCGPVDKPSWGSLTEYSHNKMMLVPSVKTPKSLSCCFIGGHTEFTPVFQDRVQSVC